jgi:hypothetical protein
MNWMGINLQEQITPQITSIVPQYPISLKIFNGATPDASGKVVATYTTYNNLLAQVQLENSQKMVHMDATAMTKIYKRFYIQSFTLTGLNRNINTGGDYIVMDDKYYKIVELPANFRTGWVCVIGVESTMIDG